MTKPKKKTDRQIKEEYEPVGTKRRMLADNVPVLFAENNFLLSLRFVRLTDRPNSAW